MVYKYLILALVFSLFSILSFASETISRIDYDNLKDTIEEMNLISVKDHTFYESDDKEYALTLNAKSLDGKTYILTNYNGNSLVYKGHEVEAFESLLFVVSND